MKELWKDEVARHLIIGIAICIAVVAILNYVVEK